MSDEPTEPAADTPVPLYAISGVALDDLERFLGAKTPDNPRGRCAGYILAVRENGPIPSDDEPRATALARLQRETALATQQRDFLLRQVDSLVGRLAGSFVAAGLIDMAGAQGMIQKEVMPINAVLGQIAQGNATPPGEESQP